MATKLDSRSWANAVRSHRSTAEKRSFVESVKQRKAVQAKSLPAKDWKSRIEASRTKSAGGGRSRTLVQPGKSKTKGRQTGGMLRSNSARSRKTLSEAERKAMVKTGDQVPKKGINASNWAYDHRKATATRRNQAAQLKAKSGNKKGINAVKWHYDHQKAVAAEKKNALKSGRPKTHTSAEKKRTQQEAIAKHQPKQPSRPKQPQRKMPQKAPARKPSR